MYLHIMYVMYMCVCVCVCVCVYEYKFYRLENVSSEATPLAVLNDTAVLKIDQIPPQGKSGPHSTKQRENFVCQKL